MRQNVFFYDFFALFFALREAGGTKKRFKYLPKRAATSLRDVKSFGKQSLLDYLSNIRSRALSGFLLQKRYGKSED